MSEDLADPRDVVEQFTIANEFATVVVRKIRTRCGVRLEIESPFFGSRVRLDALQLESLTWQEPDLFSQLLRGSIGPVTQANGARPTEQEA